MFNFKSTSMKGGTFSRRLRSSKSSFGRKSTSRGYFSSFISGSLNILQRGLVGAKDFIFVGAKHSYYSESDFRYKREIVGVLAATLFVFCLLSFFSYSATDNSWFYFSSEVREISNWCGVLGAHVSALFFFLFGSAAYLFLLGLGFFSTELFGLIPKRYLDDQKWIKSTGRGNKKKFFQQDLVQWKVIPFSLNRKIVFALFIVSGSVLFSAHNIDFVVSTAGGVVGNAITNFSLTFIGKPGTFILFYMSLLLSALVITRVSFARFLRFQGYLLKFFLNYLFMANAFMAKMSFIGIKYSFFTFTRFAKFTSIYLFVFLKNIFMRFFGTSKNVPFVDMRKNTTSMENGAVKTVNGLFGVEENSSHESCSETDKLFDDLKTLSGDFSDSSDDVVSSREAEEQFLEKFSDVEDGTFVRYEFSFKDGFYKNHDIILLQNTVLKKRVFERGIFFKVKKLLFEFAQEEKRKKIQSDALASSQLAGGLTSEGNAVSGSKIQPSGKVIPSIHYELPDFSQFVQEESYQKNLDEFEKECRERGQKLEEKLLHFGVKGKVVAIRPGPVITLFEYKPEIDSKISKIIALEDDLAMALTALSIRIVAPIPGRNVVGFEISNQQRHDVGLSEILNDDLLDDFRKKTAKDGGLPFGLGVDITGNPVMQNLIKMPHVLVAGSTGSGKSVGLNAILVSLLCGCRPDELKIILIDPKRLEFAPYDGIPHLLFPIVTSPHKAIPVLKWVVQEMEERYDIMAKNGVRNIVDYRRFYEKNRDEKELRPMPFIVIIIDELADLMMVAGKDVETYIARTAQMARAAGIHMVVATQRPSVDVLTGMIKVNFPARIAFRVSSKIDSRTIIDESGAEKLLGRGDMLFLNSGSSATQRIHGAYVSTEQIVKLCDYLRAQQEVEYLDLNEELLRSKQSNNDFEDELYDEIKSFVLSVDEVSISLLQRRYRIGFNRSARLIEQLELDGILAPQQKGKMRKVIR